jgi:LDH2 family malate/lactate/ureidoglycolate dehydrogenase
MRFVVAVLTAVGVSTRDAETTANRLIEGDARGQRAHGLARLPAYARRIEAGGIDPRATPTILRDSLVVALVDGHNALGPVVMTFAAETAISKARQHGLSWIGVKGSNHAGASGVYVQRLTDAGLIGIYAAVANSNQMAPWGGTDKLLGTNPLAIGLPRRGHPPVILDMATTTASFARIRQAIAAGMPISPNWLIDNSGHAVTDPARVDDATLTPVGGYKGYGLSLIIALLAGALNGAPIGSRLVDHYADNATPTNTGHLLIALDPDLLDDKDSFQDAVDAQIDEIRNSTRIPGVDRILVPGDRSAAVQASAAARGLELDDTLQQELRRLGDRLGVPFPEEG